MRKQAEQARLCPTPSTPHLAPQQRPLPEEAARTQLGEHGALQPVPHERRALLARTGDASKQAGAGHTVPQS